MFIKKKKNYQISSDNQIKWKIEILKIILAQEIMLACYINIHEIASFLPTFSLKLLTLDYGKSKLFRDSPAEWNILR